MTSPAGHAFCVIDASVTLKWFLDDEEGVTAARSLRAAVLHGDLTLLVSPLWWVETLNGLVMAARRNRYPKELLRETLDALQAVPALAVHPSLRAVLDLAEQHRLTIYDAVYVAIAQQYGVVLWTGDRALYRAVAGADRDVRWIGAVP